jgi:serine/threonine protein kinase
MFYELKQGEEQQYLEYWAELRESKKAADQDLWKKIQPQQGIGNKKRKFVVKTFDAAKLGKGLPYELVPASPAADIWAFGLVIFHLCSKCPLLPLKDDGDLDPSAVQQAATWTQAQIRAAVQNMDCSDEGAKSLLEMLLCVDAEKRATLEWATILDHPFFTGKGDSELTADIRAIRQEQQRQGEEQRKQTALLNKIHDNTIKLKDMSGKLADKLQRTERVLLNAVVEGIDTTRTAMPSRASRSLAAIARRSSEPVAMMAQRAFFGSCKT